MRQNVGRALRRKLFTALYLDVKSLLDDSPPIRYRLPCIVYGFGVGKSARRIGGLRRGVARRIAKLIAEGRAEGYVQPAPIIKSGDKSYDHRRVIAINGRLYCRAPAGEMPHHDLAIPVLGGVPRENRPRTNAWGGAKLGVRG